MKIIWILPLMFCSCHPHFVIKELPLKNQTIKIESYSGFCELDKTDPESAAVKSAIFGKHEKSLYYATVNEHIKQDFSNKSFIHGIDSLLITHFVDSLYKTVNGSIELLGEDQRFLIELLMGDFKPGNVFKNARIVSAKDYILDQVLNNNFVLINEAHYSSQHREFVTSLLSELYHQYGFKYLALEALSLKDSLLERRGYANIHTGYYIKDPSFGNMINEAISLGYKLISYESDKYDRGSSRDLDQAQNIIRQTLALDSNAKVLVYAGYSHINECCLDDSYVPLGARLKEIIGEDILTIDQVEMTGFLSRDKENEYYKFVLDTLGDRITSPSIVLNQNDIPILSPLGKNNFDLQIYHPRTHFDNGRPAWLIRNRNFYPIPVELKKWAGQLLSIVYFDQPDDAVPVDQFVLKEDGSKYMLLTSGKYRARIISCNGEIIATYKIEID